MPYDEDDNSDDDEDSEERPQHAQPEMDGDSSSDDNDSAAAAHAAAIGHSPQPISTKTTVAGSKAVLESLERQKVNGETAGAPSDDPVSSSAAKLMTVRTGEAGNNDSEVMGEKKIEDEVMESTPEENDAASKKEKKPSFFCPHNLNERDSDENTAIHVAIHARKLEHVKLLVEAGASVHKRSDGSPPIHAAIAMGSLPKYSKFAYECVVFLNENGADITAKDEAMHTPLYLACMYKLPEIVSYILSTETGATTLNLRADRSQGRALHAAAKFDMPSKGPTTAVAPGHPRIPQLHHHHPDGTVANAHNHTPGFAGKVEPVPSVGKQAPKSAPITNGQSLVTQILLKTEGIEIDPTNSVGQTPLHVACSRGNWTTVRLLLQAGASPEMADRRGFTPGQHAHKRGLVIPNDLMEILGGPPCSGTVAPPRDQIVDPDSSTLILTHELCGLHRTCAPIKRDPQADPPPENVRRLSVLVNNETGILRTGEFSHCSWENETRRAAMVDVLKVGLLCLML